MTKKRTLLFIPLLLAAIVLFAFVRQPTMCVARFRAADPVIVNPLMGWAVDATSEPQRVELDHSLVYATLTWRDFEPEPGAYDFEGFEEKNHLEAWWREGKRLVLRFVMDQPGDAAHRDIPDWLCERLGAGAGAAYDNAYGRGFTPNYTSLILMERHRAAIAALARRYDGHPGVAFIEMGSVGHDGGWVLGDVPDGLTLPPAADMKSWVFSYTNAFVQTPILMSGPYQSAVVAGLGYYNDNLGNRTATWDWLDSLEFGGYDQKMGAEKRAIPGALQSLPSGARLAHGLGTAALFTAGTDSLLSQIVHTHATYVSGLGGTGLNREELEGINLLRDAMGYRLWVREARYPEAIRAGYRLAVTVTLRNDGVQAFSQPWPVELSLIRDDEVVCRQRARFDLRGVLPGQATTRLTLDTPRELAGKFDLAIGIIDPMTGEAAVSLAMSGKKVQNRAVLGEITLTR